MKRLFGLTGLTYLSALAVVFYFDNIILLYVLLALSVVAIGVFIFVKLKNKMNISIVAVSASVLLACLSLILFSNICYLPIINNYSHKEINVSGYVCDDVQKSDKSFVYTIQTDKINDKSVNTKISIISYFDLQAEAFDKVNCKMFAYTNANNQSKSKGVFLKAYTDDVFVIENTGEKQITPYYYAVCVRNALKNSLDTLLPDDYSSLCRAMLLGDKQALSYDILSDFSSTGTTFLIVVSGLHLSIISAVVLFLIKKITKRKLPICLTVCFTVLAFMTLTGFTPSVVRSGVMLIITYCGMVLFSKADAINSMGISAFVLALFNPFAVGDIGLLLSFMATAGILFWAKPINKAIISKLELKRKFAIYISNAVSVSLAASVWILPITMLAFNTASPLVVLVSVLTEPFVGILIVCALFSSVLYLCPLISFLAYPFALVAGLSGKYILWIENIFASIPISTVNTNKPYFYVWLFITLVLVLIGYFIKHKSTYIICSVVTSLIVLFAGWGVYTLFSLNTTTITVLSSGNGVCAITENADNLSLISCGGAKAKCEDIIEEISEYGNDIDNIIIPKQNNKYNAYNTQLISEFDVANILVYDIDNKEQAMLSKYDGQNRSVFGNNVHFSINLSPNLTDDVYNINGVTYQYLKGQTKSLLFVPTGGNINDLPQNLRNADYLLIDDVPDESQLLECDTVIFSGTNANFEKQYNSVKEITDNILNTVHKSVKITL